MPHIPHLIVGAGPQKYKLIRGKFSLPFAILERQQKLSAHPSAHYLNMRTMEILDELSIRLPLEDLQKFKNYAYIRRIGESPFAITNQLLNHEPHSYTQYAHLPQSLFVNTVYEGIKEHVQLGVEVNKIEMLKDTIRVNDHYTCDYLYGCDGLNGTVRDYLKIPLVGNRDVQRFLNIHFTSKQLVERLQEYDSMLTFVYNSDITAVIIKHRLEDGTFAIQIPLDLLSGKTDVQDVKHLRQDQVLIKQLINQTLLRPVNDIDIKSVGFWRMGAVVAQNYYQGRCILVGDACHGMPPAGGFGMNTGIQDAHNLAYKILEQVDLKHYQSERQQIAKDNIATAMKYYQKSLEIARSLTFDYNKLKVYQNVMQHFPDFVYRAGVKLGGSLIELDPIVSRLKINEGLPLVFPKEEISFKYNQGDLGENGGQLAPLEVRKALRKLPRQWYCINGSCNTRNAKSIEIDGVGSMIVRSDMHIYQQ